jgi:hypothetical protein
VKRTSGRALLLSGLATAVLAGGSTVAIALEPSNSTPQTAETINALPYVEDSSGVPPLSAPSDATSLMVESSCSPGVPIFAPRWAKYTATQATKIIAETSDRAWVETDARVAVVSGDLSTVLACGVAKDDGARSAVLPLAAGATAYVVTYVIADPGEQGPRNGTSGAFSTGLYVTATSGVVPVNDRKANASLITTVPYSGAFDSTMAAPGGEGTCDSNGETRDVWWRFTPSTTGLYRATVTNQSASFASAQVFDATGTCQLPSSGQDVELQGGSTYYIQATGFDGYYGLGFPTSGQGTLSLRRVDDSSPTWATLPTTSVATGATLKTVASPCLAGTYNSSLPVTVDYAASDPQSGVASYRVDGASVGIATRIAATSYEDDTACGEGSRRKIVTAVNGDGYSSTPAQWPANRLAVVEDPNLTYTGSWSSANCSCWSGGSVRKTTAAQASASFTVPALFVNEGGASVNTGQYTLGLVMAKGVGRGKAAVYLDGVNKATVDTYSSSSINQTIVWRAVVSPGRHTIRVVNLATAGRNRIDVDSVVALAR